MSKTDSLAESLFATFQQGFPLIEGKNGVKTLKAVSKKSAEQRLNDFYRHARDVRRVNKLWVINWARVVLKLQNHLTIAGYPQDITSKLLVAMIFASSSRQ